MKYTAGTDSLPVCPMSLVRFGQSFRDARIAAGKTQADVAQESGVSRVAISRLETGALSELGVSKLLNVLRTVGLGLFVLPHALEKGAEFHVEQSDIEHPRPRTRVRTRRTGP
jgi:transcriptional regulator with XRE-family HTH domain